jgi:uncharacterized protein
LKVGVVGCGPAGLFTAYELSKNPGIDVTILEQGPDVEARKSLLHGVGGAGTYSDGKINVHPQIGGDLYNFLPRDEAWALLYELETKFRQLGVTGEYEMNEEKERKIRAFQELASKNGIEFLPYKTVHVGTDRLPEIISGFKQELITKGVNFLLETQVVEILPPEGHGTHRVLVRSEAETEKVLDFDALILAPGRSGSTWLDGQAEKLGMLRHFTGVDVGIRVEVPAQLMEEVVDLSYDAKLRIEKTPTYGDSVRTFCTCPYGFVVMEEYNGFVGVNGHSEKSRQSPNTNFAVLNKVRLTEPVEDTNKYSRTIARLAATIGGKKAIIQRLGDLEKGRRSTWERISKNKVKPTLYDVTPGDISMALTMRIITNLKESLYKLDRIIPGLADDATLLYCPEFKTYALEIVTSKKMETSVPGVFVAGDGAGISRGIMGAAWSGTIAARAVAELAGTRIPAHQ